MDYTTQNQNDENAKQAMEVVDLFAEELPTQHDLRPPLYTVGTASTYGSCVSSVSTVSTV